MLGTTCTNIPTGIATLRREKAVALNFAYFTVNLRLVPKTIMHIVHSLSYDDVSLPEF